MTRALRSFNPITSLADAVDGVVWPIRRAARLRRLASDAHLERRVPGWVQVRQDARGDGTLHFARVWLYGVPLWEFRCQLEGWRPEDEIVGADVVFIGHALTPILVRTRVGTIIPHSQPRLVEDA